jgi:hypothetical protein
VAGAPAVVTGGSCRRAYARQKEEPAGCSVHPDPPVIGAAGGLLDGRSGRGPPASHRGHTTSAPDRWSGGACRPNAARERVRASRVGTRDHPAAGLGQARPALRPWRAATRPRRSSWGRLLGVCWDQPRSPHRASRQDRQPPPSRQAGAIGNAAGWPVTSTGYATARLAHPAVEPARLPACPWVRGWPVGRAAAPRAGRPPPRGWGSSQGGGRRPQRGRWRGSATESTPTCSTFSGPEPHIAVARPCGARQMKVTGVASLG